MSPHSSFAQSFLMSNAVIKAAEELSEDDDSANNKSREGLEDRLLTGLTIISMGFDAVSMLKTFNFIGSENVLYRKCVDSNLDQKISLIRLLLLTRRVLIQLIKLIHARYKLHKEMKSRMFSLCTDTFVQAMRGKLKENLDRINEKIRHVLMNFLSILSYMALNALDLMKFNISKRYITSLRTVSWIFTILALSGDNSIDLCNFGFL